MDVMEEQLFLIFALARFLKICSGGIIETGMRFSVRELSGIL